MKRPPVEIVGAFTPLEDIEHLLKQIRDHQQGPIVELMRLVLTVEDDNMHVVLHKTLRDAEPRIWSQLLYEIVGYAVHGSGHTANEILDDFNDLLIEVRKQSEETAEH